MSCLVLAEAEANVHVDVLAQHAEVEKLELGGGGLLDDRLGHVARVARARPPHVEVYHLETNRVGYKDAQSLE